MSAEGNNPEVGPASPTTGGGLPSAEFGRLLAEQHELIKENNRILRQMRVWNITRVAITVVLVVVPLIGAAMLLPRFMEQYLDQFEALL